MASDPESLNSGKAATNNRVFKICGVVFSLACVSAIAYAGMAGSSSGANGRRLLQVCGQDSMQCNAGLGGYTVMRVPELHCAFAPCPNGNGHLTPVEPNVPAEGHPGEPTTAKPNMAAIIGGSVAGVAAVAAGIGGIIAWKQNHDDGSSLLMTTTATTTAVDACAPFTTEFTCPPSQCLWNGALSSCQVPAIEGRLVIGSNETTAASSSSGSSSNPWLWVGLVLLAAGFAICMAALLFCFCLPNKKRKKSALEPVVAATAEPEMEFPEQAPLMSFAPAYQVPAPGYQVAAPVYQVAAPGYQVAAPASSGYVYR